MAVEQHRLTLSGGPESPARARRAVVEWLGGHLDEDRVHDARLLVSELVTNGVRHAPDGELELHVRIDGTVRVELYDPGSGFPRPAAVAPDERTPGGRGFVLIDRIASDWGVASNGRNLVWFELYPKNTAAVS